MLHKSVFCLGEEGKRVICDVPTVPPPVLRLAAYLCSAVGDFRLRFQGRLAHLSLDWTILHAAMVSLSEAVTTLRCCCRLLAFYKKMAGMTAERLDRLAASKNNNKKACS